MGGGVEDVSQMIHAYRVRAVRVIDFKLILHPPPPNKPYSVPVPLCHTGDVEQDGTYLYIPLYMMPCL